MTARTATKDQVAAVSPFEQIKALEDQQEDRVRLALEKFNAEFEDTRSSLAKTEKEEEGSLRREAAAEVEAFAKNETAAIAKNIESETDDEVKNVDKQFKAGSAKVVDSLLESVLDCSFI